MKKINVLSSLFAAVTLSVASSAVLAYPIYNTADFYCPDISLVANYGTYVAGFGSEDILGQVNTIYFQTNRWIGGVPSSLTNYSSTGTNYESTTGNVTCTYTSSNSAENPFDLVYFVTNGQGGLIQGQSSDSITVNFPIGLR